MTGTLVENALATVTRKYGLSNAAANALAVIEGNAGPLPAGDISARMQITSGTMTTVLDTLERKGLIVRLADSADRRRVLIEITPDAYDLLDQMLPEIEQMCTIVMSALPDLTLRDLTSALSEVQQGVGELPQELPPPKPRRTPKRMRRRRN